MYPVGLSTRLLIMDFIMFQIRNLQQKTKDIVSKFKQLPEEWSRWKTKNANFENDDSMFESVAAANSIS